MRDLCFGSGRNNIKLKKFKKAWQSDHESDVMILSHGTYNMWKDSYLLCSSILSVLDNTGQVKCFRDKVNFDLGCCE